MSNLKRRKKNPFSSVSICGLNLPHEKIHFFGAGAPPRGSMYLIESMATKNVARMRIVQGHRQEFGPVNKILKFDTKQVDAVILETLASRSRWGTLPSLCKN